MAGRQPILDDYTRTDLLPPPQPSHDGVIAQTLGPDMFERYLRDMTEIYGISARHPRVRAGSSSGTATKCLIIEDSESGPVILDVIPSCHGRGLIFSQDLSRAEVKLGLKSKFETPTFFFPSPSEVGLNIMDAAPGVMEVDSLKDNPEMYRAIYFMSSTVTFYFFIGESEIRIPLDIPHYTMEVGELADRLIEELWAKIDDLDASNGSDVIDKLREYLASLDKSVEDISLLGILPVSAAACMILLRY